MSMSRKRARHLFMELSRRVYFEHKGTYKGFGKTARFYSDDWRPCGGVKKIGGYKEAWNMSIIADMRKSCNM